MMRACHVYELTFPNGKKYIGISVDPRRRFAEHVKNAVAGVRTALAHAFRCYGASSVTRSVLLTGSADYARLMERRIIAAFDTRPPNGYNLTDGGDGLINAAPEVIERIRRSKTGSKHSEETRQKMSASHRGKVLGPISEAARVNMSLAARGRKQSPEAIEKTAAFNRGRPRSMETKQKLREAKLRHWQNPEYRAQISAASSAHVHTDDHRAKNSAAKRAQWQDPAYRAKVMDARSKRGTA